MMKKLFGFDVTLTGLVTRFFTHRLDFGSFLPPAMPLRFSDVAFH